MAFVKTAVPTVVVSAVRFDQSVRFVDEWIA
jgi:hypothetical protein